MSVAGYLGLREDQWRGVVEELAQVYGWLVYYVENSTRVIERRHGPNAGQKVRVRNINVGGRGYPDLTLVRPPRLIFAELKPERGSLEEEQKTWRDKLSAVPGAEWYLWRPRDYDAIERILR